MSLVKLLNQPLTLITTGTTVDEYGDSVISNGSSVTVLGYLEQIQTEENMLDRDTVANEFQAYLPVGTSVSAYDRIGFNGQTFEVMGAPWQVYNPRTGAVSHLQLKVKVVE